MLSQNRCSKILITDHAWENLDRERKILSNVGATIVNANTGDEDELVRLAPDVDGILTCWRRVSERVIRHASRCLAIGRYGVGLDNIDVQFATQVGIVVTNVPGFCSEEVSDHAMALLLSLVRKVTFYDRKVKAGAYDLQSETPLYRMSGKTLGILGFGKIGRALCRKAKGFGLRVLICTPRVSQTDLSASEVEVVTFPEFLRRSDYISIHAPLTRETRHLFNLDAFREMKPTAFIVNTSRGDVIESKALLTALNERLIAGAALDVLPNEPPNSDDQLVLHSRTIVTPHVAFNSEESLEELQVTAAAQMADVLCGRLPPFIVNPVVLTQANLRTTFTDVKQPNFDSN